MARKRKRGNTLVGYHDRDGRVAALRSDLEQHPLEGAWLVGSGLPGMHLPPRMWVVVHVSESKDPDRLAMVREWIGEAARRLGLRHTPRIFLHGSGLNQKKLDSLIGKLMAAQSPENGKAKSEAPLTSPGSLNPNPRRRSWKNMPFKGQGGAFCAGCGKSLERYCFANSRNPNKLPRTGRLCTSCFRFVPEGERESWLRYAYASPVKRSLGQNPDK